MRKIFPSQNGWKLIISAVCYFKLGDEKRAMTLMADIDEDSLTFEENFLYCGFLCLTRQYKKANKRLNIYPQHMNSTIRKQRAIMKILCE